MSHDPTKLHVYSSTSTSQKKKKKYPQTRQIDTTISFQDIQNRIPTWCSMLNAHSMPTLTQKEFRYHGNFRTHVSAVIQMAKKGREGKRPISYNKRICETIQKICEECIAEKARIKGHTT